MPNDVREKRRQQPPDGIGRTVEVLTVDDQAVFRQVAKDVIAATPGFVSIGEAKSGEEAVAAVERLQPDLVLLDVRMSGIGGIEAARRITDDHPEAVVVLITIEDPVEIEHAAESCGAVELVRKQDFGPSLLRRLWDTHGDRQS
jgi:two-component system invasion response regulator UvrY